jgi:hypothetical protein
VRARLMENLSWGQVAIVISAIAGFLTTVVIIIVKLETLMGYYKRYDNMKRKRFAEKQQPHCQAVCPAPQAMVDVSSALDKIQTYIAHNNKMTLDLSSDRLMQKSNYFISQEFIPEVDHYTLLKMFLNYHFANGNGPAMSIVDRALKLPSVLGGEPRDIDLSRIIEIETNRRNREENGNE